MLRLYRHRGRGYNGSGRNPGLISPLRRAAGPFAYLGSDYDDQLKRLHAILDSSRIFFRRSVFSIIRGDSIADNTPLLSMLRTYINDEMVAKIGQEHCRGRALHIDTTNLDAGHPVIWNIGRKRTSSRTGMILKHDLFRYEK